MNDTWTSDDIDTAKADLLAAGWIPKTSTLWRSPSGALHLGPAGAWRTMKRAQNDETREPQPKAHVGVSRGFCGVCGQEKARTVDVGHQRICDDCFYRLRDRPKA